MTFELQHSNIPQAKLLDADPVTTDWPLPPVKVWTPINMDGRAWNRFVAWARDKARNE